MCCGRTKDPAPTPRERQTIATHSASTLTGIPSQYIGSTAMTVIGPVSGRVYRFDGPGSRLELDRRDVPHLTAVPKLKFIR